MSSKHDYQAQTGGGFDGEQAAALQWVGALSRAGGNRYTALCYVNIIGVPAGGQAGGYNGVGAPGLGILNHELGHALSLPHWGGHAEYPYQTDMHGIAAPWDSGHASTHAGPSWVFDPPSMNFLPPTCEPGVRGWLCNTNSGAAKVFTRSPMQGGGDGDQPDGMLFRHFSDYGVRQMRDYLESHVAVRTSGTTPLPTSNVYERRDGVGG